jgi:diguanylate cyclase (GGDEF)-like protein
MTTEASPIVHSRNLFDVLRQQVPSRERSVTIYRRLLAVNELSCSMSAAADIDHLEGCLSDYFHECFPDDNAWLCLRHGHRYRKIRLSGPGERRKHTAISLNNGMAGSVIKSGVALWLPDIRFSGNLPEMPVVAEETSVSSLLVIPISVSGKTIGCIEMTSCQAGRFDEIERHLGLLLVGYLSASIETMLARQELAMANSRLKDNDLRLTQLNEQLKQLAHTDEITGLYNKRRLMEQLDMETARSVRYGEVFSCLMIDIDDFKKINDTFGHPAGDEILRQTGALLRRSLRGTDFIARYGGEEFMVIMPRTDSAGAFRAAENLRSKFMTHEFVLPTACLKITISIGAATFSGSNPTNASQLMMDADEALYRAKKQGKNTTCFSDMVYEEVLKSEYCQTDGQHLTHQSVTH